MDCMLNLHEIKCTFHAQKSSSDVQHAKPGRIVISDLVVANLFMHSLPGMILLYLAALFTPKMILHEIYTYTCIIGHT